MKKPMIAALLCILASLILLLAVLFVILGKLQDNAMKDAAQDQNNDIFEYVNEQWSAYTQDYDPASEVLTLSQETTMDYDAACAYGANVYEGDLAPETFQQDAAAIARDVASHCGVPSLSVTLCYLSSDGKPIFTVSSDGEIWTCWEAAEP